MKTVLVISPHFPPINTADMQRVRMSLPYFEEFGWKPIVLAVHPDKVQGINEPLLERCVPEHVSIVRVPAISVRWASKFGIGNVGLRAFPFLYAAGLRLIETQQVDLVYFSTTVFASMPLGRIWNAKRGVPFVLDIQDPWVADIQQRWRVTRNVVKLAIMRRVHRILEPWTMRRVNGIISVSQPYIDTLCHRYPRIREIPTSTITFGADERDLRVLDSDPLENRFFKPNRDCINAVYVGRGGKDMARSLTVVFGALRAGLQRRSELFSKLRLYFIGTSYANDSRAETTVQPVAHAAGVVDQVFEHPHRVPYFEALQLLRDADMLIVPGSEDPQYSASKIYPYILARKPLLAVFHKGSSVVDILRRTKVGELVTFSQSTDDSEAIEQAYESLVKLLKDKSSGRIVNWNEFQAYTARELTRCQCHLFDRVIEGAHSTDCAA